jgi:serine/threonine protein kinase
MPDSYQHALPDGARIENYEIKGVLGLGGFGITYIAYDHSLLRDVAIKEFLPDGLALRSSDGNTLTPITEDSAKDFEYGLGRFLDEARTLAHFNDPNIVRVTRYIKTNGTAYLVMDYEEGESLAIYLKKSAVLPEEETVRALLIPILRGLRTVHAQNFLHRDIKPANIFLRKDGPPLLLDFGAARQALNNQTQALTKMVTPGYAPLEQYHSVEKQGPWSDLYGLGATMLHCVSGYPPPSATERIAAVFDDTTDPIDEVFEVVQRNYSNQLHDLIKWMVRLQPKERPQSTEEVLEFLDVEYNASPSVELTDGKTGNPAVPLSDELMKAVTVHLTRHIGPMANALVRKAGNQVSDVDVLTQLLSRFIPSEEAKTEFLGQTRILRDEENDTAPADVDAPADAPMQSAKDNEVLDPDLIKSAEKNLSIYLGPMAKIVVRKTANRCNSSDQFLNELTQEIGTENKKEFLDMFRQQTTRDTDN